MKYLSAEDIAELEALIGQPLYAPTPIDNWSSDHWTTLAYLETRIVDHRGRLNIDHLRGNRLSKHGQEFDPHQYPTRLADGEVREEHNDFDCIGDMIAHGLVETPDHDFRMPWIYEPFDPLDAYVDDDGRFALTPLGSEVAAAYRHHKASADDRAKPFKAPSSAAFRARIQQAMAVN